MGPETSNGAVASTSEPWRDLIEVALSHGRNAMSIRQELMDRHGFTGAYESVKRYVRKLRGTQSPEARAIIQTAPGDRRSITAPAPWSGTRKGASTGARVFSC